jgi:hypothetical protein
MSWANIVSVNRLSAVCSKQKIIAYGRTASKWTPDHSVRNGIASSNTLDIIGNSSKYQVQQGRSGLNRMATLHSQIMKRTSDFHCQIRETVFGIAKDILDYSTAFDTSDCVFDYDPHS